MIQITYDRYICDLERTKSKIECEYFVKTTATTNVQLIKQPTPDNNPDFTDLTKIKEADPNIEWQEIRPDDYWDSEIGSLPGFSVTGYSTIAELTNLFVFSISNLEIAQMGWLPKSGYFRKMGPMGGSQEYDKISGTTRQRLLLGMYDETRKFNNSTKKAEGECPCRIKYFVFMSYLKDYNPSPTADYSVPTTFPSIYFSP